MDDQLDNDLKNRIKEVFDNFEDASADEGWLLLREKYPEKAKRRAIAWVWLGSAAALLLLFLGILWLDYTPRTKPQLAINKKQPIDNSTPKIIEHKKDHSLTDSSAISEQSQTIAKNAHHTNTLPKNLISKSTDQQSQALAKNTHAGLPSKKSPGKLSQQQSQQVAVNTQPANPAVGNFPDRSNKQELSATISKPVTATNSVTTALLAANTPKAQNQTPIAPKTVNATKIDTGTRSPVKSMAVVTKPNVNANPGVDMLQMTKTNKALLTETNVQNQDIEKNPKSDNKAVRFGVYAATYFNYAKGSSNQLNVGAGVTSDIKLNDNLKISTGVTIAQNTLNYATQPPASTLDAVPAAVSLGRTYTTSAFASQGLYVSSTPAFKNYNASLIGLDIPIDLTYVFNPKKSDTYISAGLSSGTFINENYTYSYNYSSPLSASVNQVQDQSSHSSFNSFYFAKTLNLAFGVGYPLGKNRLIIEPFLKYPLDGLGTQQIRFGAGGLNLKFNFKH